MQDDEQCDTSKQKNQLKLNAASLFLKMQAILHVSNTATQEIVDHLNQIFSLSQPLIKDAINDILQRHGHNVTDSTLNEVVIAVMDSNVVFSATSKGAELSSCKRRKTFYRAQLSIGNASRVPFGSTWSYHDVCSNPSNDSGAV